MLVHPPTGGWEGCLFSRFSSTCSPLRVPMGAAVCNPKTGSADMPLVAGAEVISRRIMIYDKEADDFIPGSVAAFDAKAGEPCDEWRHDSVAVFSC